MHIYIYIYIYVMPVYKFRTGNKVSLLFFQKFTLFLSLQFTTASCEFQVFFH